MLADIPRAFPLCAFTFERGGANRAALKCSLTSRLGPGIMKNAPAISAKHSPHWRSTARGVNGGRHATVPSHYGVFERQDAAGLCSIHRVAARKGETERYFCFTIGGEQSLKRRAAPCVKTGVGAEIVTESSWISHKATQRLRKAVARVENIPLLYLPF